jgi:hypothetical protein
MQFRILSLVIRGISDPLLSLKNLTLARKFLQYPNKYCDYCFPALLHFSIYYSRLVRYLVGLQATELENVIKTPVDEIDLSTSKTFKLNFANVRT